MATLLETADGWGRLHFHALGGNVRKIGDARDFALQIKRPDPYGEAVEEEKPDITTDRRAIANWFAAHGGGA